MLSSQENQVMGVTGQAQCINRHLFFALLFACLCFCNLCLIPLSSKLLPCCILRECDGDFLHVVPVPKHCLAHGRDGWSTSSAQTLCPGPCSLQKGAWEVGSQPPPKPLQIISRTNCNFFSILCCDPL